MKMYNVVKCEHCKKESIIKESEIGDVIFCFNCGAAITIQEYYMDDVVLGFTQIMSENTDKSLYGITNGIPKYRCKEIYKNFLELYEVYR